MLFSTYRIASFISRSSALLSTTKLLKVISGAIPRPLATLIRAFKALLSLVLKSALKPKRDIITLLLERDSIPVRFIAVLTRTVVLFSTCLTAFFTCRRSPSLFITKFLKVISGAIPLPPATFILAFKALCSLVLKSALKPKRDIITLLLERDSIPVRFIAVLIRIVVLFSTCLTAFFTCRRSPSLFITKFLKVISGAIPRPLATLIRAFKALWSLVLKSALKPKREIRTLLLDKDCIPVRFIAVLIRIVVLFSACLVALWT